MKEYILSVGTAIAVCVIVNLMVPSTKYQGIMKIICGLFVVYTLINPIKNIFKGNLSLPDNYYTSYDEEFNRRAQSALETFDELMVQGTCLVTSEQLTSDLRKRWNSSVTAKVEGTAVRIENADAEDFDDMEDYIKRNYGLTTVFG